MVSIRERKVLLVELGIVAIISYWWFFIQTNVNPVLGNIYTNITIGAAIFFFADYLFGTKSIKLINPKNSWGKVFLIGIVAYIILLASSQIATIFSEVVPVTELLKLLASSAPVFSQSPVINFLTFGVMIAYIETYALFVIGFDLLASIFNVQINKNNLLNPKMILIMLGIAFVFMLLHVTAKGIDSEAALILVFLMAIISLVTVAIYQDARPAIILHILANSIASTALFSVSPAINFLPLLVGG